MRLCASCHRRPSRAAKQSYCRSCYREYRRTWQPPADTKDAHPRARALKLLTTFLLSPRELSCALDVSVNHASIVLLRLWQQGMCERWPYGDRSYRYRLRGL
jgi:hypothetical protein